MFLPNCNMIKMQEQVKNVFKNGKNTYEILATYVCGCKCYKIYLDNQIHLEYNVCVVKLDFLSRFAHILNLNIM